MVRAKRRHAFPCPPIPASGQQAVAVERAGQQIIRTDAGEHANGLNHVFRRLGAILPATSSRDPQFGVHAAFPVNERG